LLPGRRAGVILHIASLPGPYGIGEIGAHARAFVDRLVDMQLGVWQFLPLGPTAYGDSPYQPLSTFAGNEMLVDISDLVGLGLLADGEVQELTTLPEQYVDYGALIPVKNRLLRVAAGRFAEVADEDLHSRYLAFLEKHDAHWLHDYTLFRILKTRHGERPWPEWQPQFTRREPEALTELEASAAADIEAIKVIQFLFFEQWQRLRSYANAHGVLLFGDIPIYIALDSADAWANPEILRIDQDGHPSHVAGVPPDYFSEDGQLWGNPLYDWQHHADNGYGWWIDRVRAATELVDILRIDHFRGFEAYWAIPADAETARTGEWEPGPNGAIFDAIRNELGSLPIVAEDLGVITPPVIALRDKFSMPGMQVLQFDCVDPDFSLESVRENSVCYTGTHDNDTTVGWFHGSPDDIRTDEEIISTQKAVLEMTGGTEDTIHSDLVRVAFSCNSKLAMVPMQDILGLGSEARINTPGKLGGNWRWRLTDTQLTHRVCDNVAEMVRASGRGFSCNG
jgi:4-alpha-glucanotransferase